MESEVVNELEVLLDRLAERMAPVVAELVAARLAPTSAAGPQRIYGDQAAAAYLGWPLGRVQKRSGPGARDGLPVHRIGQRKTYLSDELDEYLERHREGAPTLRAIPA
jgi:hypothetical protein